MTATRPSGSTWSGNHRYRAAEVLLPADADELAEVVTSHARVRVQATRHTFNDVADSDDVLVSLERMPTRIDVGGDRVRVEGLVTFAQLAPVIEAEGRALHNLGSLPHISVAGAAATGTHGSGLRNGNLSSAVEALEILDADGRTHRVDRDHAWFPAAALGIGAFGVVTAVELRTEPTYTVTQQAYTGVSWDDIVGDCDRVFGSSRSVSVFTTWGDPAHDLVWAKSDTGEPTWVEELGGRPVGDDIHLGRIRTVDNTTPRGTRVRGIRGCRTSAPTRCRATATRSSRSTSCPSPRLARPSRRCGRSPRASTTSCSSPNCARSPPTGCG